MTQVGISRSACPEVCNNGLDDDGDGAVDCADSDCPACPEACTNGVDDDGDGLTDCADPDCVAHSSCVGPSYELSCTNGVDDDNDGLTDCADPDCVAHSSCVGPSYELSCTNGIDDDSDGAVDCDDVDCDLDPACVVPPVEDCTNNLDDDNDGDVDCDDTDCPACACEPADELSCDAAVGGTTNNAPGSTDLIDSYSCSSSTATGSEFTYDFVAPADGLYTVEALGPGANLDLFLLDGSSVCDGSACLQASTNTATADESITWTASAGEAFYVLVDGVNGASASFYLTLTCPEPQDCDPSDVCCGADGSFLPSSEGCAAGLDPVYECPGGTEPGDDLRITTTSRACSGMSAGCDGSSWPVSFDVDCSDSQVCVPGQAACQPLACPPSSACCTPDGGYRPAGEQCAARDLDWYCPLGEGAGGSVQQHRLWQSCTGVGPDCTGVEEWEDVGPVVQCAEDERCVEGEPDCEPLPAPDDDDASPPDDDDDDDVTYERSTWSQSCVCSTSEAPRAGWLLLLPLLLVRRRR